MKIAVVGSGGREHALVWKLGHSPEVRAIHVLPGNGGIAALATGQQGQHHMRAQMQPDLEIVVVGDSDAADVDALCRYIEHEDIELTVVGPEAALAGGLVDRLSALGRPAFGPSEHASRLESSKTWAKQFMRRHGVATAEFWSGFGVEAARQHLLQHKGDAVIKFDGLAGGKGVFVCRDLAQADHALQQIAQRHGPEAQLVVEQRLDGVELSVIGVTDGRSIRLLSPSKDHKALRDGDRGPNTGGMGAYTPVPHASAAILEQIDASIIQPTLSGLQAEAIPYKGFLYFGLMLTEQGPRLLEYNVRLGDPETEVILPALDADLLELLHSCLAGTLTGQPLEISPQAWVDVVLASRGYPGPVDSGKAISGLGDVADDALVFHAGTRLLDDRIVSSGGRVLNVVSSGSDLHRAAERCYQAASRIQFDGKTLRSDIARTLP